MAIGISDYPLIFIEIQRLLINMYYVLGTLKNASKVLCKGVVRGVLCGIWGSCAGPCAGPGLLQA